MESSQSDNFSPNKMDIKQGSTSSQVPGLFNLETRDSVIYNEIFSPLVPENKVKEEPRDDRDVFGSISTTTDDINEVEASDYFVNTSDLVNIKQEMDLKVPIKSEILSEECDLPAFKSELDFADSDQPCTSKQSLELVKKTKTNEKQMKKKKNYPCPVCRKITFSSKSRKSHVSSHFGSQCVVCPDCGQLFIKEHQYLEHLRHHFVKAATRNDRRKLLKKYTYHCRFCTNEFSSKLQLNRHLSKHSAKKPFQCKICFKRYSVLYTLRRHIPSHSGLKPFKCEICLKQFSMINLFKYHMLLHERGKQFKCEICFKEFVQKGGLIRHKIVHQGVKFTCKICHKAYTRKVTLDSHLRLHSGEHEFKCHLCQKEFTSKGALKRHLMNHRGEKPHECNYCSMRFLEKKNLVKHLRGHEKSQLLCEICHIGFLYKTRLRHHLLTVHGEKPYKCKSCPEKFTTQSELNKHASTHVQMEVFQCEICLHAFSKRSSYIRHLGRHGKKPFHCELCLSNFSSEKNIREHFFATHPGFKPFGCNICLRGFYHKRSFRKHLCEEKTKL